MYIEPVMMGYGVKLCLKARRCGKTDILGLYMNTFLKQDGTSALYFILEREEKYCAVHFCSAILTNTHVSMRTYTE
jgi:hypothetical protein